MKLAKRILSLAAAAVICLSLCAVITPVLPAAAYEAGDFDKDGEITTTDARIVLQISVSKYGYDHDIGPDQLWPDEKERADADGDGSINTTDARLILQRAVGKIDRFPSAKDLEPSGFMFAAEDNASLPFDVICTAQGSKLTATLPTGSDPGALIPTFVTEGKTIRLGETEVVSGVTALDFSSPVTLTIETQANGSKDWTVELQVLPDTGLPTMAVTLEDMADASSIEHDDYSKATVYLGGGSVSYAPAEPLTATAAIKGRGNSSWLLDEKKSYTLKLDKKAKLLDMSNSKNWALVGNYEDKTLMRNLMAEYFAEAAEVPAVMRARPVDMWIGGQYWGTYNLTEKIEIEGERVNITDVKKPDAEGFVDMAADQVGYLLEFDAHVMESNAGGILDNVGSLNPDMWEAYGWDRWEYTFYDYARSKNRNGYVYYNPDTDETFFQLRHCNGKWVTVKKPSTANLNHNPAMREYIYKKVMELDAVLANWENDQAKVSQMLDLESFAAWCLVEEIMDNTDASFHSSVYMYVDAGGKFTFGPVWDFDRSSGNCSYWHNNVGSVIGTEWGGYAFSTSAGQQALLKVYNRFKTNTANWETKMTEFTDLLRKSAEENFKRWDILGKFVYYNSDRTAAIDTFQGQVDYLREFLRNRFNQANNYTANF